MEILSLQDEIEAYVKKNGILKKDLAARVGVSPCMLSHWLKGRVSFKKSTLEKIIAELDKS